MQLRVAVGRGLEVEGEVVDEVLGKELLQHVRGEAVGVELDQQPQRLHLPQQNGEVPLEGRLPAGDDHPVDEAAPLPQLVKEGLEADNPG